MNLETFIDQMPEERMVQISMKAELFALKDALQKKATMPELESYAIEDIAKELKQEFLVALIEEEYSKPIRSFGFQIPNKAG